MCWEEILSKTCIFEKKFQPLQTKGKDFLPLK